MADLIKEVLTFFRADTSAYTAPVNKATAATEGLEDAQKDQAKATEDQQKSFLKLGKGIDSVDKLLGNMIPGLRQVNQGFKGAEKAATTFGKNTKLAIASTGIGALVLVIGGLIKKFTELKDKSAEDMSFMESKIFAVGTAITEGIGTAIDFVSQGFREFVGFLVPSLKVEMDAYDARRQAAKDLRKEQEGLAAQAETALALSKARGDDTRTQLRYERDVIAARAKVVTSTADIIALKVQEVALTKRIAEADAEVAKKREEERLKQFVATTDITMRALEAEEKAQTASEAAAAEEIARLSQKNELSRETLAIMEGNVSLVEELTYAESRLGETIENTAKKNIQAREEEQEALIGLTSTGLQAVAAFSGNRIVDAAAAAAMSILRVWESPGNFLVKLGQTAFVAFQTAKQINSMKAADSQLKSSFADGGRVPALTGGMITGQRHYQGGVKFRVGGLTNEAEGGEYIVNRSATARFLPLLESINAQGRKYATGGMVAERTENQLAALGETIQRTAASARPVLVLEDFRRAAHRLDVVENLARR